LEDCYIEPIVKGAEWKNRKRHGLKLTSEDEQIEAQAPYMKAERIR